MRTVKFVLASLFATTAAFAGDIAPRSEPASPETNDADYLATRYGAAVAVEDHPDMVVRSRGRDDAPVLVLADATSIEGLIAIRPLALADTRLHLSPRFDGVGLWAHF